MDEGDSWVEKKRLDRALEAYEGADALMHVPTTGIEVAKTLAALGRLVEAREKALDLAKPATEVEPRAFFAARREAALLAEKLDGRIPTIQIALAEGDAAGVRASVDGEALPEKATLLERRVDPGKHAIEIRAPGRAPIVKETDVKEGAHAVVTFFLGAEPDAPSNAPPKESSTKTVAATETHSTLVIAGLAVAGAGVAIGSITGLVSLSKASDARRLCGGNNNDCDPSATDTISTSRTLGWVSTAAFAVALAGAGVATYALVTPKKKDDPKVEAFVTGAGAGIRGSFR
jgi:hypothetical protein